MFFTNLTEEEYENFINHQGYTVGYSQKSQIRWLSVLDLQGKDEILKDQ